MKKHLIAFTSGLTIMALAWLAYTYFFPVDSPPVPIDHNGIMLVIDKHEQTMTVHHPTRGIIEVFDVSTGLNPGNKLVRGDQKTPEGVFPIISIEDASEWTYDFEDGNGQTEGAYGPFFLRLRVHDESIFHNSSRAFEFSSGQEFTGIGIHGTHTNEQIGERASHGCIRLRNEDLLELKEMIQPGTLVAIIPGKQDVSENYSAN